MFGKRLLIEINGNVKKRSNISTNDFDVFKRSKI